MELNRNKLVFFIISWVIVFIIIILIFIWWGSNKNKTKINTQSDFVIWTCFPDLKSTSDILESFKKAYPRYSSKSIKIENFTDYETYTYALASSFSSSTWPDVFVLNNNETPAFSDMSLWISPDVIKVWDFRKNYKTVFSDDLILKTEDGLEFLLWVPVWYEVLWLFYNKRYVRASELKTISSLNSAINRLKTTNKSSVPLAIWNWTTVAFSEDIATQFMILEDNANSFEKLTNTQIKTWLWAYLNYWYKDSNNDFNSKYSNLKDRDEKSSYLFANSDSFMIIWYPRLINDIEKNGWIPVNFLFVEPFPHYVPGKWNTLVNYNYFVLNKNSPNLTIWNDFLRFLFSSEWQKVFLKSYPFYLPAYLPLEWDIDNMKIHGKYNISIWDFYDNSYELTSFNKWIKNIYDRNMPLILDLWENYYNSFENFSRKLNCMTKKVLNFTNISNSCE